MFPLLGGSSLKISAVSEKLTIKYTHRQTDCHPFALEEAYENNFFALEGVNLKNHTMEKQSL